MDSKLRLIEAKNAYFNSGESIMEDDEYDALEEIVRREGESGAALANKTGIKPVKDDVKLPYVMLGLKKIKPGETINFFNSTGSISSATKKLFTGSWILSEKLDGVSGLWTGSKMYMRGDKAVGRDITSYINHIAGIKSIPSGIAIRGEICLRKVDTPQAGPARSQVNGWLHRLTTETTLKPRFVAYEVLGEKYTRRQQFELLEKLGFEVPWYTFTTKLNEEILKDLLLERKAQTVYDIDGIVVGTAEEYEVLSPSAETPKTIMAFKMPLDEQCAITDVIAIEWNISRLGYWMPRIQINPVSIGGVTINWVTGHNAEFIVKSVIGPGASVKIRRSGDVIPIIDSVIKIAASGVPDLPAEGEWTWHGVNAKATDGGADQMKKQILHTLKTLKVDGAGPSAVAAMWDFGITSFRDLLNWSKSKATEALGPTTGPRLIDRSREALANANLETLIVACPLARGTGITKIRAAIDKENDITKWSKMSAPSGWSTDTWSAFTKDIPRIIALIESWGRPVETFMEDADEDEEMVEMRGEVCFTGFRDAELERRSEAKGFTTASGVKRGLVALIIPSTEDPVSYASSKADKAREYKIPIMRKSDWESHISKY